MSVCVQVRTSEINAPFFRGYSSKMRTDTSTNCKLHTKYYSAVQNKFEIKSDNFAVLLHGSAI